METPDKYAFPAMCDQVERMILAVFQVRKHAIQRMIAVVLAPL